MAIVPATATSTIAAAISAPLRVWIKVIATELAVLVLGAGAYLAVAAGAADRADTAAAHARSLLGAETALGLDIERPLATWWDASAVRAEFADLYYVTAHFAVPFVVFGLLVLIRPAAYRQYRTAFVTTSLVGVMMSWLWPVAPPRLVESVANAPMISGAENPYAAFPSMHVGWALWSAVAVAAITTRWWVRTLAWLHALVTGVDVLVTGNHWLFDVAGGVLAAVAGLGAASLWSRSAGADATRPPGGAAAASAPRSAPSSGRPEGRPAIRWPRAADRRK